MRKYRNTPVVVDGIRFDSQAEAIRYAELMLLAHAGEISALELQPVFVLHASGTRIGTYRADFQYADRAGQRVVEDVKSPATKTPLYRWKVKHLLAEHGIRVTEVYRRASKS